MYPKKSGIQPVQGFGETVNNNQISLVFSKKYLKIVKLAGSPISFGLF